MPLQEEVDDRAAAGADSAIARERQLEEQQLAQADEESLEERYDDVVKRLRLAGPPRGEEAGEVEEAAPMNESATEVELTEEAPEASEASEASERSDSLPGSRRGSSVEETTSAEVMREWWIQFSGNVFRPHRIWAVT